IFNTMSYQSKTLDAFVDGAVTAAAEGDKAGYEKDVKGFVDTAFADMPRIPIFQPYVNVAMQKNVSGYQYWFHRRLDYRSFVKAERNSPLVIPSPVRGLHGLPTRSEEGDCP